MYLLFFFLLIKILKVKDSMAKYIVNLTEEERFHLEDMVKKGKAAAYKIKHANILLKANINGSNWTDLQIAEAFSCHSNTVHGIRKRMVLEGIDSAIERKAQVSPSRKRILDGKAEATLIATSLSKAPEGHSRWTLRMLADKLVELEVVDSVSHETVRSTLKKTKSNLT